MRQQQQSMHPEDTRNLIIFMVLAVIVWFGFDHFVLKPKMDALRAQQQIALESKQQAAIATEQAAAATAASQAPVAARLKINSDQLEGTFSLTGGRFDDVALKSYKATLSGEELVRLLAPVGTEEPQYVETGWVTTDSSIAVPDKNAVWSLAAGSAEELTTQTPVELVWKNPQGVTFTRKISVNEDFLISVEQTVHNGSGREISLMPYASAARRGIHVSREKSAISHDGAVGYVADDLVELTYKKMAKRPLEEYTGSQGWIGLTDKYWLVGLLPNQTSEKNFRFVYAAPVNPAEQPLYQTDLTEAAVTVAPNAQVSVTQNIYVGAKQVRLLEKYEELLGVNHFDLAVDFGMLYFLTRPFHFLLTHFYTWTGNFGVAILLLTALIRVAIFPLASTSYRAFARLKTVAPAMQELKEKHKDDKQAFQKEMVKLYEREKVNPMAGCLPILLQIPVFFAMYRVIGITIEMRHAPFFGWIQDLSAPDPTSFVNLFGLLPFDPPGFLHIGAWSCLMLLFMLIQTRLNPPPTDATQRTMMLYMPFIMTFIMAGFPAGLIIYWTFSNFLSVCQQAYIMKSMGVPIHLFGETDEAKAKKAEKKSKKSPKDGEVIEHEPSKVVKERKKREKVELAPEDTLFGGDGAKRD